MLGDPQAAEDAGRRRQLARLVARVTWAAVSEMVAGVLHPGEMGAAVEKALAALGEGRCTVIDAVLPAPP